MGIAGKPLVVKEECHKFHMSAQLSEIFVKHSSLHTEMFGTNFSALVLPVDL